MVLTATIAAGAVILDIPLYFEPAQASASNDADTLALGEQVYKSQCAVCHGVNLEGQANWRQRKPDGKLPAPPHDASGHTWHHDDETLFALTKYGLSALVGRSIPTDMPAYEGVLSDEQIRAALAYIKSRWPEDIRRRQDEMNRRATEERRR
jgi:mono/diheme cytochrome c family protein